MMQIAPWAAPAAAHPVGPGGDAAAAAAHVPDFAAIAAPPDVAGPDAAGHPVCSSPHLAASARSPDAIPADPRPAHVDAVIAATPLRQPRHASPGPVAGRVLPRAEAEVSGPAASSRADEIESGAPDAWSVPPSRSDPAVEIAAPAPASRPAGADAGVAAPSGQDRAQGGDAWAGASPFGGAQPAAGATGARRNDPSLSSGASAALSPPGSARVEPSPNGTEGGSVADAVAFVAAVALPTSPVIAADAPPDAPSSAGAVAQSLPPTAPPKAIKVGDAPAAPRSDHDGDGAVPPSPAPGGGGPAVPAVAAAEAAAVRPATGGASPGAAAAIPFTAAAPSGMAGDPPVAGAEDDAPKQEGAPGPSGATPRDGAAPAAGTEQLRAGVAARPVGTSDPGEGAAEPSIVPPGAAETAAAAGGPAPRGSEAPAAAAAQGGPPDPAAAAEAVRRLAASIAMSRDGERVELRLDPPELGRVAIDIRIEDGRLIAALTAERPETLDLMRRHADALQRELAAAGFDRPALSFSDGTPGDRRGAAPSAARAYAADGDDRPAAAARPRGPADRLDIRL